VPFTRTVSPSITPIGPDNFGVGRMISTFVAWRLGLHCQLRNAMVAAKASTATATAPRTIGKLDRRRNGIAGDMPKSAKPLRARAGCAWIAAFDRMISCAGPKQRPAKDGKAKMKSLLVLVAICFAASVFAQDVAPKVGDKLLVQVKPRAPIGCKLVGTVKGTKLWAGNCTASEASGAAIEASPPLDAQAAGTIPSGPK
jgi:hypothetical protein